MNKNHPQEPPFGLWPSPLSARDLGVAKRLSEVAWSDDKTVVWLEGRSSVGMLFARKVDEDNAGRLTGDFSVRAEVGYGGGDFTTAGDSVYFAKQRDGRIFRQPVNGGEAAPITQPMGKAAAPLVTPDGSWLIYVHHDEAGVDRLAAIPTSGEGWPIILAQGHDFYAQPCLSSCGKRLAYVAWDHPNMPWDSSILYVADVHLNKGHLFLDEARAVAGGNGHAIFQPQFARNKNHLFYVSNENDWGHLWRHDLKNDERRRLTDGDAEHGFPNWLQNMRSYSLYDGGKKALVARCEAGRVRLCEVDTQTGATAPIAALEKYGEAEQLIASPDGRSIAMIAGGPKTPPELVVYDSKTDSARVIARSSIGFFDNEPFVEPRSVTWNNRGSQTVHGLFYDVPKDHFASPGKPPLIVLVHGGPTAQVRMGWDKEAQFFASRGYAVLVPNYRGSPGYGRAYMRALRGQWGVAEVDDIVSAVAYLADEGFIDGSRAAIMGGSAGGYSVLQCMINAPEVFAAGISRYGVTDLMQLTKDTHKFEKHYLDGLVGPLPDAEAIYHRRSPVYHAARIKRPLAIFQGGEDKVVPQNQAEAIVKALKSNGVDVTYRLYPDEGHGFRNSETLESYYREVEAFLRKHVLRV